MALLPTCKTVSGIHAVIHLGKVNRGLSPRDRRDFTSVAYGQKIVHKPRKMPSLIIQEASHALLICLEDQRIRISPFFDSFRIIQKHLF